MTAMKRTSWFLSFISAWFLVSAIVSLIMVRTLYLTELPSSIHNLPTQINAIQDLTLLKNVCVAAINYASSQKEFSWVLAKWSFSFVAVWTVIFIIGLVFLKKQLNIFKQVEFPSQLESPFDLAISGKLPLWKAFWVVFIGLSYGLAITIYVLLYSLRQFHLIDSGKVPDLILMTLAYSLMFVICLFTADIAWRCSRNSTNNIWHYLSRVAILLIIVLPLIKGMFLLYRLHVIAF